MLPTDTRCLEVFAMLEDITFRRQCKNESVTVYTIYIAVANDDVCTACHSLHEDNDWDAYDSCDA